jgi:drug/metabolite transporter (DMT)-like permease
MLREEGLTASLLYTGLGAIVPMSLVVGRVWTPLTMSDVVPAFLTGLLSLAILGCFDLALDLGPVWWVAPFLPAVLIWEVLLAGAVHHAPVSHLDLLGIALVALASILALRGVMRRPNPNPATRVAVPSTAAGDLNHG